MEEVRLYENDYEKPDLTDDVLEHYGVKGMKWGVRKSEERADKAYNLASRTKSVSEAHISKIKARSDYKKQLAMFTGNEKHVKSALKTEKRTRLAEAKVKRLNDVLAARAKYKNAVAKQKRELYNQSLERGRDLVESGAVPKSTASILKGFLGRGILTGSVRAVSKIDIPGKKKGIVKSLIAGKTGKAAAIGYNMKMTISDLRSNNDIKVYEDYLLDERRRQMYHSDISEDNINDIIEHYGVLGMKWGIRKDGKPQGFQYGTKDHLRKTAGKTALTAVGAYATKKAMEDYNRAKKSSNKRWQKASGGKVIATSAATALAAGSAAKSAKNAYDAYKREQLRDVDPNKYASNREAIEARDIKYITANKDRFSVNEMNEVMNRLQTEQRLNDFYRQQNPSAKDSVKKILKNPIVKTAAVVAVGTGGYLLMQNTRAYKEGKAEAIKLGKTPPSVIDIFEKTVKGYGPAFKGNVGNLVENAFGNMQSGKSWNSKGKNKK